MSIAFKQPATRQNKNEVIMHDDDDTFPTRGMWALYKCYTNEDQVLEIAPLSSKPTLGIKRTVAAMLRVFTA